MNKKILGYVAGVMLIISSGCTNSTTLQPITNNISVIQSSKITGANLAVNISFKDFATKASSNGAAARTVSDIKSVKLYLTKSSGNNPLLASNIQFSSGVLTYTSGQTYTFSNVPVGTYYVAAELFSDTNANTNIVEPITYTSTATGDTASGFTGGQRGLTLSSNSATVATDNTVTFSDSSSSFAVAPKLLNAIGATVGTTANITGGNTTTNAITAQ